MRSLHQASDNRADEPCESGCRAASAAIRLARPAAGFTTVSRVLEMADRPMPACEIHHAEQLAGQPLLWPPRLDKNIGHAIVPIEFAALATELKVETPSESTCAVGARKPFIDPEKEIPTQDLAATAAAKDNSAGS
jgi:hypothetical protein